MDVFEWLFGWSRRTPAAVTTLGAAMRKVMTSTLPDPPVLPDPPAADAPPVADPPPAAAAAAAPPPVVAPAPPPPPPPPPPPVEPYRTVLSRASETTDTAIGAVRAEEAQLHGLEESRDGMAAEMMSMSNQISAATARVAAAQVQAISARDAEIDVLRGLPFATSE